MAQIAERYTSQLPRLKQSVEQAYQYFRPNFDRYNYFHRFVFETALDSETIALLKTLKKPQIEFNICEAYISRLRGEFSKQEPSIEVMAGDEAEVDIPTIETVQGHIKHSLYEANKDGFEYRIYTDMLAGGFSVAKVLTDYASPMSLNQVIKVERVYDPTLCGFDPMARLPHKGDGRYCFELFPKTKDAFQDEYPNVNLGALGFTRDLEGFNWSYQNGKEDILLICDFYEKQKKRVKIMQLANGKVYTEAQYKDFLEDWAAKGTIEQPPTVVKERKTEIDTIVRYRFIENQLLEYIETQYSMLPLIFFDGNSVLIRHGVTSQVTQMCRPYIYNARGIQRLKNFAGQTLANELENLVQHKWKVAKEALPLEEEYLEAYRNPQQADVLVFNAFRDDDPKVPIPPPEAVQRVNIPPEITNTFIGADQMTQTILGNFDMDLGRLNKSQVSGIAVQESITQSNSAAMPFVVGYLHGITRIAEQFLDLIPKYYKTPRTIPVMGRDGKKDFIYVNQQPGMPGQQGMQQQAPVNLQYGASALNVKVEAGVNFSVQKSRALEQIISLMQASPLFAQFMNTEGLEILLDNIEIKGIDSIKAMAGQWTQQMRQAQQQQAQQPNPDMLKAQHAQAQLQQKGQKDQMDFALGQAKLQKDMAKLQADIMQMQAQIHIENKKAETEITAHKIDAHLQHKDMVLTHANKARELEHKIAVANRSQSRSDKG